MADIIKFVVGKKYFCRSICDHDCVWSYTITSRTESTITFTDDKGKVAFVDLTTTECRGMNVNGKINKFGEAFYVYGYSGVATLICCEDPATLDESYKKDHSKGMSGYVEYTWRSIDGSTKTGCEKITVKPVKGGDIIAIDKGE